jgi:dihydropteroate synthase
MSANQSHPLSARRILPDAKPSRLRCPRATLPLGQRTLVMGILNITPDSFSDGGKYLDPAAAVRHALELVRDGADIIDVGGESTRPAAQDIPEEEEIRRVLPVIESLAEKADVPISVDTRKSGVARRAVKAGAQIINDISALHHDPEMLRVAAENGTPVVLMHMRGTPATMQQYTTYGDLMREVEDYLLAAVSECINAGLGYDQVVVDPGIGFAKNAEQNLEILGNLHKLASLRLPLMVGVSRKSFIGRILGLPSEERLEGTAAAVAACVLGGADIVRVHDVREMVRVIKVCDAVRSKMKR